MGEQRKSIAHMALMTIKTEVKSVEQRIAANARSAESESQADQKRLDGEDAKPGPPKKSFLRKNIVLTKVKSETQ